MLTQKAEKYKMAVANSTTDLEKYIEMLLLDGWFLFGSPFTNDGLFLSGDDKVIQSMSAWSNGRAQRYER